MNFARDKIAKYKHVIQGVSIKGNPTLAVYCALITGCMNAIFAWSQRAQLLNDKFFVSF